MEKIKQVQIQVVQWLSQKWQQLVAFICQCAQSMKTLFLELVNKLPKKEQIVSLRTWVQIQVTQWLSQKWQLLTNMSMRITNWHHATLEYNLTPFAYLIERCPFDAVIVIHSRELLPRAPGSTKEGGLQYYLEKNKKLHPFYIALGEVRGISQVRTDHGGYEMQITRGDLFTWEELIPQVVMAIKIHLASGRSMKPTGKPRHNKQVHESSLKRDLTD